MTQSEILRPKILLVDDTPENLALLQETLEPAGYELFIATTGEKALEIASIIKPDIILLDIMMPGINGYETCKKLKKDRELKDIPVIFLSALNSPEDKVKAFETGGVDYISKPFNHMEVLARVKAHLTTSEMIKSMNHLIKKAFHEIYTPLGIIDTGVEMQILEYGDTEYLESIKAASRSLHMIYEDIYYSLKKEISKFEPEPVELEGFIKSRIKYFSVIAKTKNMSFETEFNSTVSSVFINPAELQRVIDNTISNAIKYGYENTKIKIGTKKINGKIGLYIQNRGKTIKDKHKIFLQLYREEEDSMGLGLGLDIVRMICKKYNIDIKVDSKDNVTTFTYCFKEEK
ncbi:hybrid sensor histidine kinase/response regulator [Nitrosophilus alvini]|uniref:ATP-binding response regulator n=1 Tax=Nitrosophilus alvini TaxID=2714855 RepID=UPI00190CBCCD|nr:hybrid sensor histidine kinase/response regulator [Nitrosophilus alvini]